MSWFGADIIRRCARAAGIPVITDAEYTRIMTARQQRSEEKARVAKKANDVLGDYIHGLNADNMRTWIEKGIADE